MFKNRMEFAIAMLEGRKFKKENGSTILYDRYGSCFVSQDEEKRDTLKHFDKVKELKEDE